MFVWFGKSNFSGKFRSQGAKVSNIPIASNLHLASYKTYNESQETQEKHQVFQSAGFRIRDAIKRIFLLDR